MTVTFFGPFSLSKGYSYNFNRAKIATINAAKQPSLSLPLFARSTDAKNEDMAVMAKEHWVSFETVQQPFVLAPGLQANETGALLWSLSLCWRTSTLKTFCDEEMDSFTQP